MDGGTQTKRKTRRHNFNLYFVGVVLGIAIIAIAAVGMQYRARVLSFEHAPVAYTAAPDQERKLPPNQILIPSINVATSVVPGSNQGGIWTIPAHAVAHLITSARPGEQGNIILYGHNTTNILKRLPNISIGDEITITDEAGTKHIYVVDNTQTVPPSEMQVLEPSPVEKLTIYTCTGLFDQNRFVATAFPKG